MPQPAMAWVIHHRRTKPDREGLKMGDGYTEFGMKHPEDTEHELKQHIAALETENERLKSCIETYQRACRQKREIIEDQLNTIKSLIMGVEDHTGKEGTTAVLTYIARLEAENERLKGKLADGLVELKALIKAYVNLLESGRDRIIERGGNCDPVDVMEANDPHLIEARRFIREAQQEDEL